MREWTVLMHEFSRKIRGVLAAHLTSPLCASARTELIFPAHFSDLEQRRPTRYHV